MMIQSVSLYLLVCFVIVDSSVENNFDTKKALIKKHLKRLRKQEGAIKLVGGRDEFEGNVEILHDNQWGAICDDDWDQSEAIVICRQLGYKGYDAKATNSSQFGHPKRKYWMDNVFCNGTELDISECRFNGWGQSDCGETEAAGVICQELEQISVPTSVNQIIMHSMPEKVQVRLQDGRLPSEGRVEIRHVGEPWQPVCGQGWSILEANVVCRSLSLGYAMNALQTDHFGAGKGRPFPSIKCNGEESSLQHCSYNVFGGCEMGDVAAVQCTDKMADLVIDYAEIIRTAHLEDRQMMFLTCAMEENCLASQAYVIQKEETNWHLETRRLLKFTAKILNVGAADFRPAIPKDLWEWHMCHMHYHSMEVFATFDIFDKNMAKVAEGHKASFCLEDNQCLPGVEPRYACANYGDQGISVNCSDIYKYTVDCQWIDISDIDPGVYTLKVAINPQFKVGEVTFENNAAYCQFYYGVSMGTVGNCSLGRP